MNVLILCDKFLPISEQFIYNQINSLRGHKLFLFARKSTQRELYDLNFRKELIWYNKPILRLRYKLHSGNNQFPDSVQQQLKNFIESNSVDLIYVHYGTTAISYLDCLKAVKKPVICAFHGFDASRKLGDVKYREAIGLLSKSSFKFTAPSDYLIDKLAGIGIQQEKLMKIPYGANIDKIKAIPKKSTPLGGEKITIIHAGRIVEKKGVPDLVRVFLRIADKYEQVFLKIVGGGEEEDKVLELVNSSRHSQRVEMTGPLSHHELVQAVKSADIFVLNSRVSNSGETEGLPNSIMEAMACDTAVISTKHSGIPEIIKSETNGLLVNPRNNDQLESALLRLIENEHLRLQLRSEAMKTVEQYFSLTSMSQLINDLVTSAGT